VAPEMRPAIARLRTSRRLAGASTMSPCTGSSTRSPCGWWSASTSGLADADYAAEPPGSTQIIVLCRTLRAIDPEQVPV
jgi:hypothetical protein